jgi:hypothetical protein
MLLDNERHHTFPLQLFVSQPVALFVSCMLLKSPSQHLVKPEDSETIATVDLSPEGEADPSEHLTCIVWTSHEGKEYSLGNRTFCRVFTST